MKCICLNIFYQVLKSSLICLLLPDVVDEDVDHLADQLSFEHALLLLLGRLLLLAVSEDELDLNPLLLDVVPHIQQHVLLQGIAHDHLLDEARISFLLLHYEAFVLV